MTALAHPGTLSVSRGCPSLYAAFILARLVLRVKQRLRARMKSARQLTMPSILSDYDILHARGLHGAKHAIKARCQKFWSRLPDWKSKVVGEAENEIPTLLHELDSQIAPDNASMVTIAKQDALFLQQDASKTVEANKRESLRHIFNVVTLLLDRLQHLSNSHHPTQGRRHDDEENTLDYLDCPKTVANLEHLLQCLRQAIVEALTSDLLKDVGADIASWRQYWQQGNKLFRAWFSEWPNGPRPLNTTWPWNMEPSLIVLWGVCWMFYDCNPVNTRRTSGPSPPPQPLQQAPSNSGRRGLPLRTTPQDDWNNLWLSPDLPGSTQSTYVPALGNYKYNISTPNFANVSNIVQLTPVQLTNIGTVAEQHSPSSNTAPYWQGSLSPLASSDPNLGPVGFPINDPSPLNSATGQPPGRSRGGPEAHGSWTVSPIIEAESCQNGANLAVPQQSNMSYPSPFSENSPVLSPCSAKVIPGMLEGVRVSTEGSPSSGREKSVVVGDAEVNEKGPYQCLHTDCANEAQVFSRKCEYTKHRDKHDRPYVCKVPGCEKILGFTYPGGLLRHEREVHRQHGGPKANLVCPHSNCKRHSEPGFSRKENLNEHLRRVHRNAAEEPTHSGFVSFPGVADRTRFSGSGFPLRDTEKSRKRRRGERRAGGNHEDGEAGSDSDDDDDDAGEEGDLRFQVVCLRKKVEMTDRNLKKADEKIDKLEKQVEKLSAGLRAAAT